MNGEEYVKGVDHFVKYNLNDGDECIIKSVIDLNGASVQLPANVMITLKRGGAIINGTLIGNNTRINSRERDILGVKLDGTWHVDKISDLAFIKECLSDQDIIDNINAVQSDSISNTITISRNYIMTIPSSGGSGLKPSSHSAIFIRSKLILKENDFKSYQIIDIRNKEDVFISGGELIGDVGRHTYIEGTSSEWGMGVCITQSQDVTISDLYIAGCTGDGLYITGGKEESIGFYDYSSKNIVIKNVICDFNRRQGMSLIHVDGLIVKDCSFVNTGQIDGYTASAGIDIEPNVSYGRNMSVRNVIVDNCSFINNKGASVATNNTYEDEGRVNYENIVFSNCRGDGLLSVQSTNLSFRGCLFKEIRFAAVYFPTHIVFNDCTIKGGFGIKIYTPSMKGVESKDRLLSVVFNKCTLSVSKDQTETTALINCYKPYITNIKGIYFYECRLSIPPSSNKVFALTNNPFMKKIQVFSSTIEMKGRTFDSESIYLQDSIIDSDNLL